MFIRYFAALCFVALCFSAVFADEEPEVENRANPAAKVVAKIIGSLFTGAAVNCLGEAAGKCKDHWKNPKAAFKCGKDFLKANKGRCAV